ncbi:MAG TPA: aldo/keto reductase [Sandaracinaceae bacterium LLY-WYZ-13_1]|nr:aldo/keto reductase [Sandaracinaceae bacterium LLY-WYZ-13_1]
MARRDSPPTTAPGDHASRRLAGRAVFPVGFGAMNLSLPDAPSRREAIATVHAALDAGVDLVDTADVYAPDADAAGHNEALIAEALAGIADRPLVATKGGVRRRGERWWHDGRPAHLRAACEASLRRLRVEAIDLYYLHAVDDAVPVEESVGALARLREEGKVRAVGLSNVDHPTLARAAEVTPIAAVQNEAGPQRPGFAEDGVVAWCETHGAGFVAHSPMGGWRAGRTAHLAPLRAVADALGTDPFGAVLAWLLSTSPAVIPIPGASRPANARASAAAADLRLEPAARRRLVATLKRGRSGRS